MSLDKHRWLTVMQASKVLGLHISSVYDAITDGKLKRKTRYGMKGVWLLRKDVEAWAALRVAPKTEIRATKDTRCCECNKLFSGDKLTYFKRGFWCRACLCPPLTEADILRAATMIDLKSNYAPMLDADSYGEKVMSEEGKKKRVITARLNANNKLNPEKVIEIRAKAKQKEYTHKRLSEEYDVTQRTIQAVVYYQTWIDIGEETNAA